MNEKKQLDEEQLVLIQSILHIQYIDISTLYTCISVIGCATPPPIVMEVKNRVPPKGVAFQMQLFSASMIMGRKSHAHATDICLDQL